MAPQRRLTIPEAARLSGISDQLLRRYARSKRLRARLGDDGQWGVWLRDLQTFLAAYRPHRGRPRTDRVGEPQAELR